MRVQVVRDADDATTRLDGAHDAQLLLRHPVDPKRGGLLLDSR